MVYRTHFWVFLELVCDWIYQIDISHVYPFLQSSLNTFRIPLEYLDHGKPTLAAPALPMPGAVKTLLNPTCNLEDSWPMKLSYGYLLAFMFQFGQKWKIMLLKFHVLFVLPRLITLSGAKEPSIAVVCSIACHSLHLRISTHSDCIVT